MSSYTTSKRSSPHKSPTASSKEVDEGEVCRLTMFSVCAKTQISKAFKDQPLVNIVVYTWATYLAATQFELEIPMGLAIDSEALDT